MLFVIVNGWDLLIGSLIRSFRGVWIWQKKCL
jgi:type III secretory pathway component EscR